MPALGGKWPPRSISLRLFFLLKAVPAAREGRIKRCAGAQGMATRGGHWDPARELVYEPGWAGTENTFRGNRSPENIPGLLELPPGLWAQDMFPRQVTLIDWRCSCPLSSSRAQCRVPFRQ